MGTGMLIKQADDKSARLAELERRMQSAGHEGKQAKDDFHRLKAGIKGEKDSAYFIDFTYGEASQNWAVIHDLRLEHKGRVAQIDHLLINRFWEIYVLETKHFNSGIRITEDGEFLRWNDWRKTYEGMESPLLQNERHIAVLKDVCATLEMPERLGIRMQPDFQSLVLVSSGAKIMRPKKSAFDSSRVIKADQLKTRIEKDIEGASPLSILLKTPKLVSADTVHALARQLAARHAPLAPSPSQPAEPRRPVEQHAQASRVAVSVAAPVPTPTSTPTPAAGPTCKSCGSTAGAILYGQYGYYFKCQACQANTAIKFTCKPGHKPRLRKSGPRFFRDCEDCKSSSVYFDNPEPT